IFQMSTPPPLIPACAPGDFDLTLMATVTSSGTPVEGAFVVFSAGAPSGTRARVRGRFCEFPAQVLTDANGIAVVHYTFTASALALPVAACRQAVLNAPPSATLTVTASPTVIPQTGGDSTISAAVRLPNGMLVPDGVIVNFFTTLGAIEPQATTVSGFATVHLR